MAREIAMIVSRVVPGARSFVLRQNPYELLNNVEEKEKATVVPTSPDDIYAAVLYIFSHATELQLG